MRLLRSGAVVVVAVVAGGGLAAATSASADPLSATVDGCRLVELPLPEGGYDGGVMDIEVVDGETVYYGSYHVRDESGEEHQRVALWRGLEGGPEPVDPGFGAWSDIAFELTESGLISGVSEDADRGNPKPWVIDLATGAVALIDTTRGSAGDGSEMWVRRINDAGAVVGSDAPGVGSKGNMRAYGWEHFTGDAVRLDASSFASQGWGINNLGDRSGFMAKGKQPKYPHWTDYNPVVWHADGSTTPLPRVGIDAVARMVKDDRTAAGDGWWGWSIDTGHVEPVFWPSYDEVVGLGVLDGGGWGRVFGMDEGGWLVGAVDRWTEETPVTPFGFTDHAFLYIHGTTAPGHLRILPSLHAVETGESDWREWHGSAVHAVNAGLDQAASGSHSGFADDGTPTWGATVWVNASQCGVEVETTHDPWHLTDLESARAESAEAGS
ncbi:hypothetical protein [Agromyces sp. M3QZ16-3]|uniref:hypothetical protein n=1 Tax=Agromyces sp. M3QZ16-3 TaxID=3447585 RepID=UPI003F6943C1